MKYFVRHEKCFMEVLSTSHFHDFLFFGFRISELVTSPLAYAHQHSARGLGNRIRNINGWKLVGKSLLPEILMQKYREMTGNAEQIGFNLRQLILQEIFFKNCPNIDNMCPIIDHYIFCRPFFLVTWDFTPVWHAQPSTDLLNWNARGGVAPNG